MANFVLAIDLFSITVLLFLLITYKKKLFNSFYLSGFPGFIAGVILSLGFCGYVLHV